MFARIAISSSRAGKDPKTAVRLDSAKARSASLLDKSCIKMKPDFRTLAAKMASNVLAEETDRHPPPWHPFTIARSRVLAFAPFAGPDVLRGKLTAYRGASEIHEHLFPGLTMLNAGGGAPGPATRVRGRSRTRLAAVSGQRVHHAYRRRVWWRAQEARSGRSASSSFAL